MLCGQNSADNGVAATMHSIAYHYFGESAIGILPVKRGEKVTSILGGICRHTAAIQRTLVHLGGSRVLVESRT